MQKFYNRYWRKRDHNDAGLGMLQALGFRFLDKSGHTLGKAGGQIMEAVAKDDYTSGIHPIKKHTS